MYANIVLFTGLVGCAAATSSSLPYSEETQSSAAFASPTSEACANALAELIQDMPDIPSKMESYISSYDTKVTNTAACWFTIPSTFDSIYSSYIEFSYSSWYDAHSAEIRSFESKCDTYFDGTSSSEAICGTGGTVATTTGDTVATAKTTASGTVAASTATGAAARNFVTAGAVIAAGSLFVIAL